MLNHLNPAVPHSFITILPVSARLYTYAWFVPPIGGFLAYTCVCVRVGNQMDAKESDMSDTLSPSKDRSSDDTSGQ